MNKSKAVGGASVMTMISLAFACLANNAGSGFGSGQEVMQYFVSFGTKGILGFFFDTALWVLASVLIILDVRKYGINSLREVFTFYCGKILGNILFVLSFAYLFVLIGIMLSGSGASFEQYFGVNPIVGRLMMSVLAIGVCVFGMKKAVDIIGKLGPLICIFIAIISIMAILNPSNTFAEANAFVNEHAVELLRPSSSCAWSSFAFSAISLSFMIAFVSGLPRTNPMGTKQLAKTYVLGGVFYLIDAMLMVTALLLHVTTLLNVQVPVLALGQMYASWIGIIFGAVLLCAIFTTVVPLIWGVAEVIIPETSKWYVPVCIVVTVLSFFVSGFASFSNLLSMLFSVMNWTCIPLFLAVLLRRPVIKIFKIKVRRPEKNYDTCWIGKAVVQKEE